MLSFSWYVTPKLDAYLNVIKTRKVENSSYILAGRLLRQQEVLLPTHFTSTPLTTGNNELDASVGGPLHLSHIAAITGNTPFFYQLYKRGLHQKNITNTNVSPFHLAALCGHVELLNHAIQWGCNLEKYTDCPLSPIDVLEMVHPDKARFCLCNHLPGQLLIIREGKLIQVPLEELEKEYHFTYTEHVCKNAATMESLLFSQTGPRILPSNPSLSSLAIIPLNEFNPSMDLGLGLIATTFIAAGTPLGRYAGLHFFPNTTSKHQLEGGPFIAPNGTMMEKGSIDGERFHNLTSLISDGIPNVRFTNKSYDKEGCFISITDIQPGEFILWNYGHKHSVKRQKEYVDFSKKTIPALIDELPLLIHRIKHLKEDDFAMARLNKDFSLHYLYHQLMFFFDSPRLFIKQILTNSFDISLLDDVFYEKAALLNRIVGGGKGFENDYVIKMFSLSNQLSTLQKNHLMEYLETLDMKPFNRCIRNIEKNDLSFLDEMKR